MVFMPTPSIQQLSELVSVNQNKGTSNMREHVKAHGPRGRTIMKGIGIYTNEKTGLQLLKPVRPSQVLLSRPHTRSFTKPTSQPTSTTATSPADAPVSASSGPDATATVSPEAKLAKLTIQRHPPKN
ncbi:hypothetical protein V6N13_126866 [Hibiscus sabdariffa]